MTSTCETREAGERLGGDIVGELDRGAGTAPEVVLGLLARRAHESNRLEWEHRREMSRAWRTCVGSGVRNLQMSLLVILAASAAASGCSKHAEPPPPAKAPEPVKTPVAASDAAVVAAVDAAPAAGSGTGRGAGSRVTPVTAADKAADATYRAAMKRGRKATDAKTYPDAIAAFDEALKARPNEPHALAERGFAKLLAGTDLDSASGDFDHAADATKDPKLLGMIWFNRGLVDDKLGHADAALVDYYLANQLLPSKTVAAKIAGKKSARCASPRTRRSARTRRSMPPIGSRSPRR